MVQYLEFGQAMTLQQKKIQHLFLRAGFGETPATVNRLQNTPLHSIVDDLFNSSKELKDISYLPYPLKENEEMKGVSAFKAVKMILKSKQDMEELNGEWIFKMAYTKAVLREKMTFFWHNHFATSTPFAYLMQVQNNMLRSHALGKFGDMLHAVAKDPAMILYLNNQQNKKGHPNENFGREVMELFTLGVGHYTERDIKEGARAFTGWTVNAKGEYEFHPGQHDDGEKEFLGRKGNFGGEDILNILLEQKQTAIFITTKIYREFVNPVVDAKRVSALADDYFASGYDTEKLMRNIFTSDWFYADENIGVKITSPVELIVRYKKLLALEFKKPKNQLEVQKALGQVLFFPPNVSGWKGNTNWIDSASLLIRLSIPQYIVNGSAMQLKSKPHFEENPDEQVETIENDKVESDWKELQAAFDNVSEDRLTDTLLTNFIQCNPENINKEVLKVNANLSKDKRLIQTMANVMSLPEFQLI
jgi:uncharacterized protein (DUF1800 family)